MDVLSIYALDPVTKEATGTVSPFCSDNCRQSAVESVSTGQSDMAMGISKVTDFGYAPVCEQCSVPIGPAEVRISVGVLASLVDMANIHLEQIRPRAKDGAYRAGLLELGKRERSVAKAKLILIESALPADAVTGNRDVGYMNLDIALYSAYFMQGLQSADYNLVLDRAGNGCVELISQMVKFAPYLSRIEEAAARSRSDEGYPGVLAYEVAEPFGKWLGEYIVEHGELPTEEKSKEWLSSAVISFFIQYEDVEHVAAIKKEVAQHPDLKRRACQIVMHGCTFI